mmetsp:Transcript_76547/g.183381  ORF Transcript_76547/g.183381 Transcript_76547/m.183381 type:complete len:214 (-) Transcript_76547:123-764(-)
MRGLGSLSLPPKPPGLLYSKSSLTGSIGALDGLDGLGTSVLEPPAELLRPRSTAPLLLSESSCLLEVRDPSSRPEELLCGGTSDSVRSRFCSLVSPGSLLRISSCKPFTASLMLPERSLGRGSGGLGSFCASCTEFFSPLDSEVCFLLSTVSDTSSCSSCASASCSSSASSKPNKAAHAAQDLKSVAGPWSSYLVSSSSGCLPQKTQVPGSTS